MTNKELAEQLSMLANHQGLDDDHFIRQAARLLRDMPDGERIEGIVVEESRDFKTKKLWRIVFDQRDPDMADPYGYARITAFIHPQEPDGDATGVP